MNGKKKAINEHCLNSVHSYSSESNKNPLLTLTEEELVAQLCPATTLDSWTFTAKEIREALHGDRILCPSIELSNLCNLNCPYCYVETANTVEKEQYSNQLSFSDIDRLLRLLADSGAITVNIIGAGEPTIDPMFVKVMRLIASLKMKPLVGTNGIQIANSQEIVDVLVETDASVVLKYNSIDANNQDKLVGRMGYAAIRDKALQILWEAGLNTHKPTRLALNSLLLKANENEILELHSFCRTNNMTLIAGDYMPTGRTKNGEFHGEKVLCSIGQKQAADLSLYEPVEPWKRKMIAEKIAVKDARRGLYASSSIAYVSGLPCVQALGICIDNQGLIWPCPARNQLIKGALIPSPIASIRETESLLELWHNHSYLRDFRKSFDGSCCYKPDIKLESSDRKDISHSHSNCGCESVAYLKSQ